MKASPELKDNHRALLARVRVNAPAVLLRSGRLDLLLDQRIRPELGLDAWVIDRMPRSELADMAGRLKAAGLRPSVHGPFVDLAPGGADPKILEVTRDRLHKALEAAAVFKPEHIVFHAGFDRKRHGFYVEKWLEASFETWRPLARRSAGLGIRLVLENTYELTPYELKPLLDGLAPEGVGFCFDTGHASAFGEAPVLDWVEVLGEHLQAMHLHDNHGGWDDHLPIGQGRVDFEALFHYLGDRYAQAPAVTLEPHREEDIWPSLAALAELWPWDTAPQ